MSISFAENMLKRIEAGEPDLGWKVEELREAIKKAKAQ